MKVLYDYQALMLQKYGGVSRYIYELTEKMKKLDSEFEMKMSVVFSKNAYFKKHVHCSILVDSFRGCNRILNTVNKSNSFLDLLTHHYDIVHPTYYNADYLLALAPRCKKHNTKIVVTAHDMIHELLLNPSTTKDYNSAIGYKKEILHIADCIIAISQNTKDDLLRIYPDLDPEKIEVIYHGFSRFVGNQKIQIQLPENYVLFVGQRAQYKNFETFTMAMVELMQEHDNLHVVCAGGGKLSEDDLKNVPKNLQTRFLQFAVNDSELALMYENARCFAYPSLYEGFGIPILEAFCCNCPVALSNSSCFPEIAGDAAIYFDGNNVQSIRDVIANIAWNENQRNELIEKGNKRLKLYTWEDAAKKTLAVYHRLLEK